MLTSYFRAKMGILLVFAHKNYIILPFYAKEHILFLCLGILLLLFPAGLTSVNIIQKLSRKENL